MTARSDVYATCDRAEVVARVAEAYARERDRVFRLALRYGRVDREWAEDVVQDVFVALCRAAEGLDDLDDLGGWLYRATTNACLGRLRREALRDALTLRWLRGPPAPAPDSDPEHTSATLEQARRVLARLDVLPPRERVAFCMHVLDGRDQVEIAEVLGISKSWVCKLIRRANERLRAAEGEHG
jgi:RNA polymerase sigma-70 factor (ECF subfamily)